MPKKCLRFHFFNSPGIGPWLIKARLGSRISHVGIEFEDKRYFHATFWHGMVEQPLSEGSMEIALILKLNTHMGNTRTQTRFNQPRTNPRRIKEMEPQALFRHIPFLV
jgi:hypothetical protein